MDTMAERADEVQKKLKMSETKDAESGGTSRSQI
jgi:hypothetical protein